MTTKRLKAHSNLPPNSINLALFDVSDALPVKTTYANLNTAQLNKRLQQGFDLAFAKGKALVSFATLPPHSIGREEFRLDPMPDKPGEIVYAFGSFVHDGHLPDTISASTRVHFVQPALQVGASGYSKKGITADTRPTKTFATSKEIKRLFNGLPEHLRTLIPIISGGLLFIPEQAIKDEPYLKRFSFTFERHLISIGHFHLHSGKGDLIPFDSTRIYHSLTSKRARLANIAITDVARFHLGSLLRLSLKHGVDFPAAYDIGHRIIWIRPDPLVNVALYVDPPATESEPAVGWTIRVTQSLEDRLGAVFQILPEGTVGNLTFGVRPGGIALGVPLSPSQRLEVALTPEDLGNEGTSAVMAILNAAIAS
ncbi:hypothetical protein C6P46_004618 [Rhodotorula mucilaginosa]|uniref:Uncharacterized protein n=1 Tax=Rhodotorula mucilaginosa TaxID=5537 RepID=A0A9P7B570_RHOMI|nr:hypothetical protein C6P46_004618 [Rhodotorula mucilaginosa]